MRLKNQTNNRITDLIPSGVIHNQIKLVLTNTIYFKGEWFKPFNEKYTRDRDFWITPDKSIKIPMMSLTSSLPMYYDKDENKKQLYNTMLDEKLFICLNDYFLNQIKEKSTDYLRKNKGKK